VRRRARSRRRTFAAGLSAASREERFRALPPPAPFAPAAGDGDPPGAVPVAPAPGAPLPDVPAEPDDPDDPDEPEPFAARVLPPGVETLGVDTDGTDPAGVRTVGVETDGTETDGVRTGAVGAGALGAGTLGTGTVGAAGGVGTAGGLGAGGVGTGSDGTGGGVGAGGVGTGRDGTGGVGTVGVGTGNCAPAGSPVIPIVMTTTPAPNHQRPRNITASPWSVKGEFPLQRGPNVGPSRPLGAQGPPFSRRRCGKPV
jgi:hypothetical protein